MKENRLMFLQGSFPNFELCFSNDFYKADIVNPNWDENITVYDEEYEFIVCFSYQHCHFENEEDVVAWIREIIACNKFAIEFFNKEKRYCGTEIDWKELKDLSYEMLETITGYYGVAKLWSLADTFKVRGWDQRYNFDAMIVHQADIGTTIERLSC